MLILLAANRQRADVDTLGPARQMRRCNMAPPDQPAAMTAAAPVRASAERLTHGQPVGSGLLELHQ